MIGANNTDEKEKLMYHSTTNRKIDSIKVGFHASVYFERGKKTRRSLLLDMHVSTCAFVSLTCQIVDGCVC